MWVFPMAIEQLRTCFSGRIKRVNLLKARGERDGPSFNLILVIKPIFKWHESLHRMLYTI